VRRQLICLPTGTGKTVIFAQFPSFFRMKRRMLILAHRAELLNQARDKLLAANPALRVDIEQAGKSASENSDVVVASVPTIGRRGSRRIAPAVCTSNVGAGFSPIPEFGRAIFGIFGGLATANPVFSSGGPLNPEYGD
jgi:superfamily II DNA or RNA helicase